MFWLIILPLIAVVLSLIFIDYHYTETRVFGSILTALISVFIGAIILGLTPISINGVTQTEEYIAEVQYIEAFKDFSQTEGSVTGIVFMISGKLDEKMVYRYIQTTDYGMVFKTIDVNTDNTYIKYTNEKPRIETIYIRTVGSKFKIGWFCRQGEEYDNFVRNVIYIPNGSVKVQYEVDLE